MKTLEHFIEDQCGMVTPKLLELLEPHRQCVETALKHFNNSEKDWDEFSKTLWTFLPEPKKDHYTRKTLDD